MMTSCIKVFPHPCFVYAAQYHPGSPRLVVTGGYDRLIRVWTNRSEGLNGQVSAEQCRAVQRSAAQCSAVQCSAVQCSAVQCSAVQRSTAAQCSAVQCSAAQHSNTAQCSAAQHSAAAQCSAVLGAPLSRLLHSSALYRVALCQGTLYHAPPY